jgi:hypothetical protein
MKKLFNNIKRSFNSTILCIRFPFLYPRNRFSGSHYTNWKLKDKQSELYKKAYESGFENGHIYIKRISLKYAILFKLLQFYNDWISQLFHCIPTFTELDAMPTGWRKAFGIQMCKEIRNTLLCNGGLKALFRYRITQIKEKYGTLRWYDAGSCQDIFNIISKYEDMSSKICINCGKPATKISHGWISYYCSDCAPENSHDLKDGEYL